YSACSGVPVLETAVEYLVNSRYNRPFAPDLVVLSPVPEQMKGQELALKRVSPEEDHFALLQATARDLKKNAFVEEWATVWRSVPCTFLVQLKDNGEHFWLALKRREKIGADFETMYPSLVQRIYQLGVFWIQASTREKRKLNELELHEAFSKNLVVSSGERVTEKFVKVGMQIFKNILSVTALKELLIAGDETFGKKSPLDYLYKLQSFVQCSHNDADKIEWCLLAMFDLLLNNKVKPGELTQDNLAGKKGGKG
ncbi:unnamed protein product, partial [Symbiodinium sp. CCMP2456]